MEKSILSMKLKEYREAKGMTQQELAELLQVSDKSISKWELGNGYPSKKNMMKITELLDLSLEVLLIEENKEERNLAKRSIQYGLFSYIIIFAATIAWAGWRDRGRYEDILTWSSSEIMEVVLKVFAQNIITALVPALIIGLVFHFYILPKQQSE